MDLVLSGWILVQEEILQVLIKVQVPILIYLDRSKLL